MHASDDSPAAVIARYGAALDVADEHLAAGRRRKAGAAFGEAMRIAYDRSLHFDSLNSPMAFDPEAFTGPLQRSRTARALRAIRGRSNEPTRRSPLQRPTNVLVVTRKNANFLGHLQRHLQRSAEFEYRFLDLADHLDLIEPVRAPGRMAQEILTGREGLAERVEQLLRPHFDWADVLFIEWCTAHAVLLNLIDPRGTRVVVRLHSYEVFTAWPQMLDMARIDDLLFVSEHLRDLTADAVPGLRSPEAPRLTALPLSLDLQRFVRAKETGARFTLGLVGWASVAKDPLWAFEVLRRLRAHDERYRLLLVGSDFEADKSPATAAYAERLNIELAELEAIGAVRRTGQTDDVPAILTRIGVMLSSSVRESFHAGLVEGAASGAVPVVRDWPFFAGRETGARSLFPEDWIVESPEHAVERVLAATATDETWRRAGEMVSGHALDTWDWEVVRPAYDDFLRRT